MSRTFGVDDMIRIFVTFILLLLTPLVSIAGTEYLLTKQEFVQWKKASKKIMDVSLKDYTNVLPAKKRSHFLDEQNQWTSSLTKRCAKAKDFESCQECLAIAYKKRAEEIDTRLIIELKKQHIAFNYPKFPVNLNDGEFQMDSIGDGKYSFSFLVHGGNGHECGGSGIAIWDGASFSGIPDTMETLHENFPGAGEAEMPEVNELNKNCSLVITFFPHTVILSGNGECHEYFICGMRTSVYGEFQRNDFHLPSQKHRTNSSSGRLDSRR